MKNIYTIIAFALIVFLSLIPPIDFFFTNPFTDKWFLLIVIGGFFGFYTLFLKTNPMVKIIAVFSFMDCFFSVAPFISFTSYVSVIICCYFYIVCTRIENWKIIFNMLQAILFLNVFMMFMQSIGKDTLLNWQETGIAHYGIVGQHMQMASFSVVICAILISFSRFNFIFPFLISIFCCSTWNIFSSGAGFITYLLYKSKKTALIFLIVFSAAFLFMGLKGAKFSENTNVTGRLPVWADSIRAANEKPWTGWGPGTYKFIFPQISNSRHHGTYYKNAHNFIAQLLFEVGYPMTLFILFSIGYLIYIVIKSKQIILLSGIVMIFSDALVHFPDRQIQTIPLIILFVAFCERKVKHGYISV